MTTETVEGGLPDEVTQLNFTIDNVSFNLSLFGGFVNCLYQGNARAILVPLDTGTDTYDSAVVVLDESVSLPKHSGSLCPGEGALEGTRSLEKRWNR